MLQMIQTPLEILNPDQTFTQNLLSDGVDIYRNKSSICSI